MKKNLLTLGALILSISASAQQDGVLTYVGNGALVTVLDGALVYSGGGWENSTQGRVVNSGDIMISSTDGSDVLTLPNSGDSFVLKYENSSTYGQLYISGISQGNINGKVKKQYKADFNHSDDVSQLGRQQVSLPFYGYTIGDLKGVLGSYVNVTNTALTTAGRFNVASAFKWNNDKMRFDQLSGSDAATIGKPLDYIILPRRSQNATASEFYLEWDAANDLKEFVGVPAADDDNNTVININGVGNSVNFGVNGTGINYFRERYNSYIVDPFREKTPSWAESGYGKNLYQFANPFLTNLDLSRIGGDLDGDDDGININNLEGIAYFEGGSIKWNSATGSTYVEDNIKTLIFSGGKLQTGDVDYAVIKPMGEFMIKMTDNTTKSVSIRNARRFAQEARTSGAYSPTSNKSVNAGIPAEYVVKQVAVVLKNSEGNELARTYYAVSPSASTGYATTNKMQSYASSLPIYTKEEIPTGGEDVNRTEKLYINSANEIDFAKKKLPLFIEKDQVASISFELYEGGVKLNEGEALSTGKSFYLKRDNEITQIQPNKSIPFVQGEFALYYDTPEGFLGTETATPLSQTIIAKKSADWVIRFAKDWKQADVEVYSSVGQLVFSAKKVSTSQDFIIPLSSDVKGMFIVKTTSSNGEVVTKKIVN